MCLLASSVLVLVILHLLRVEANTHRPIIGIVCHEIGNTKRSYIEANYVKALEASGAKVAPIFLWRSPEYYSHMVKSLNGVVFQGGNAGYQVKGGYFETAAKIFAIARKLNYGGDHFPILGVCLGFEFLSIFSNNMNTTGTLEDCNVNDKLLPLQFTPDFRNSSLYADASQEIIDTLAMQNITANYHQYCLRPETKLRHPWHILSLNKDPAGKLFVSSMETTGPMVGIQFHPEKNAYGQKAPSYKEALIASRHFYDWVVTEARKNDHFFSNSTEEKEALVYNYCPVYVPTYKNVYEQLYIFD